MKSSLNCTVALSFGLMLAALTMDLNAPAQEQASWIKDFETGRQAARTSGKPIFLVFRCER